jgi:hypothetical protein
LVLTPAHGVETRWQLAAVQRLPAAEPGDGTGFLPSPRFCIENRWLQNLQQGGSAERVPQDPDASCVYSEDRDSNTIWFIRVFRMTFGLRNAGNTFQGRMDRIMAGLDFVFLYLDDFIIGSRSVEEGVEEVEFLGHHMNAMGVAPIASRFAAILGHPQPTTVKELQGFIGVINFYRSFMPAAACILKPLSGQLKGNLKPAAAVCWMAERQAAFAAAKAALTGSVRLIHPSTGAEISEISLLVYASAEHIGAVLQQQSHPAALWRPLEFFSRKLDATQVKYSAFERELLACVSGFRHFRHMLDGRQFTIYTDHKPLTYALSRTSDPWSARQVRQLSYLAEHTADIWHIAGEENVVAFTLSRPPPSAAANVKEPSGSLAAA